MNLFNRLRKPNPTKALRPEDDNIMGFALHASGRVDAIKQGSGIYGSGFGSQAYSETAFGSQVALSQSTFGWSAAYAVSCWVYRCIEVRKSAVHRMPWHVYSKRNKQIINNHPLEIALKRNKQKLLKKIEQSQLLYGETFIELGSNDFGFVSDFFWLNNNGLAVIVGAGHIAGYSYTAMQGGLPQNFDVEEVAFMKTDNPFNDLRGMSPTEVIMDDVAIDKDVARVVRAYYANDTRVGLLLIPTTNLQPADSQRFMDEWKKQSQGVNRAGKPMLLPQDIKVERVQEPATLDDVQLRESTRRAIAAGYGVPLTMAGGWDDAKYQSLPEQRKSFYEETVIPECDNVAEFINEQIMPRIDEGQRAEFKFDYMAIQALTEDAQKKNDIYTNRLIGGLITRAEAREALGHPVRPADHVYYIPSGATVVPDDVEALVTPTANAVDDTAQEQQNDPPAPPPAPGKPSIAPPKPKPSLPKPPAPPKQLPANSPAPVPEQQDAPIGAKAIEPPQRTANEELAAWEKKAINNGALKATSFVCYVLPRDMQAPIRDGLRQVGRTGTKAAIRVVFSEAKKALAPSPAALNYWAKYDDLMKRIGHDWLQDYMRPAFQALLPTIGPAHSEADTQKALDGVHGAFTTKLLGTVDKPGVLVKLIMAGMAAGQEAIAHGSAANPNKPPSKVKDIGLAIDWDLLAHEAMDFARQYVFNLIKNVDDTTRKAVSDAVTNWVQSGDGLDSLKRSLGQIFDDQKRADLIAQTESTRAYAEGSKERYRRADVKQVTWNTVNDAVVCPICSELEDGGPYDLDSVSPPQHPGCRCWLRPVIE